ncbi:MAG: VWA domain-containing protein [Myxococcota bacterium]
MRFAEPWAFVALLIVPAFVLAHIWMSRRRERQIAAAGDPPLLSKMALIGPSAGLIRGVQAIITVVALVLVGIALARPQFGLRTEVRRARGMDVVIALDLSRSMLAQDVVPSRLARARIELSDLVDRLRGDRVGLLGFTSLPLPLCPLTVDRAALKLQLNAASPDDLPRGGTAIGLAIEEGLRMLENARATGGSQAIIVVTDGEEHEGDPEAAAQKAAEAGVQVHVVGVGSRTGEPIPLVDKKGRAKGYLKDRAGKTVVSRLNEGMLQKIAEAGTGLVALPGAQGGIDLNPVRRHLGTLRRAELEDRVVRVYEERYQWFLVPAFILLMLAALLRPSKPRRTVVGHLTALTLLFTFLADPGVSRAAGPLESEDPDVAKGNAALQAGKAEEAQLSYQRARDRLGDRPEILFNSALTDVARGELDQAISGFQSAANLSTNPSLRGRASFARGNALRKLKRFDEALDAYKNALMADPSLSGARRNYEITQRLKAIQDAQPKDQNEDGEPDEDNPSPDAGTGDGGPSDGGGQGQGDGGPPDAGPPDGGSNQNDGGGDSPPDAGNDRGKGDAGAQDASTKPPTPSKEQEEPEEDVDRQQAEAILDALQDQEEALKRERLLKRYKGRAVTKDW